ncbi:hypothetical protein GCM10020000_70690 [Streptomyces olivoverticillatus]
MRLDQKGLTVRSAESEGMSSRAREAEPSSSGRDTLAVSRSIEPERLQGFFEPLTR